MIERAKPEVIPNCNPALKLLVIEYDPNKHRVESSKHVLPGWRVNDLHEDPPWAEPIVMSLGGWNEIAMVLDESDGHVEDVDAWFPSVGEAEAFWLEKARRRWLEHIAASKSDAA